MATTMWLFCAGTENEKDENWTPQCSSDNDDNGIESYSETNCKCNFRKLYCTSYIFLYCISFKSLKFKITILPYIEGLNKCILLTQNI